MSLLTTTPCISFQIMAKRYFSYIGKQPIVIDPSIKIDISPIIDDHSNTYKRTEYATLVTMNGPLGNVSFPVVKGLLVSHNYKVPPNLHDSKSSVSATSGLSAEQDIIISLDSERSNYKYKFTKYHEKFVQSMWGTTQRLLTNFVTGITEGHKTIIRLVGIGYKVRIENESVILKAGQSHFIQIPIPVGVVAECPSPTKVELTGINKQQLNIFAARIRSVRKPEPYKGKGIYVNDEKIKLKVSNKK